MPRDREALARAMAEALDIPGAEAQLYLKTLVEGRCSPGGSGKSTAASLAARGMLIRDADGKSYLAVHPRMALSNLFRAYEERAARERKEKRLLVDRLTFELITLLPEETKGTNPGSPRGGRTR